MKAYYQFLFFLIFFPSAAFSQLSADTIAITIKTRLGDIDAILFAKKAPLTCTNFLDYVDAGAYEGGQFYRTVTQANQPHNKVRIEVIQGGVNVARVDTSHVKPIALETTSLTGIFHKDGTLSMARDAPNTATTEFFICIGDQPSLDFGGKRNPDGQGFAAFGQVTKGMDIIKKIQGSPVHEQKLTPSIKILNIYRK